MTVEERSEQTAETKEQVEVIEEGSDGSKSVREGHKLSHEQRMGIPQREPANRARLGKEFPQQ